MLITLILSIVAVVLALVGCATPIVVGIMVGAWVIAMLDGIGAILYFKFNLFKFYYHDILGWHRPDASPKRFDGLSEHSVCKHCGKDIMQDSQGNWFC